MSTAVDVLPWVLSTDGRCHISLANLPLTEWVADTRTLCLGRLTVSRMGLPPSPRMAHLVCRGCVAELEAMGETIPAGLVRRKGPRR